METDLDSEGLFRRWALHGRWVVGNAGVDDYDNVGPGSPFSGLNDMHRAGWAQNFGVIGTPTPRATAWA